MKQHPETRTPGGNRANAEDTKENGAIVTQQAAACLDKTTTPGKFPAYTGTREAWAYAVLDFIAPRLAPLGISMPEGRTVRVGVLPLSRGRLGQCSPSARSACGTVCFIGLGTKQVDPRELVHTLIHEYMHACDDCQSGHRHRWARWAAALGMKAKGHDRSTALAALIDSALHHVGLPAAHVPSVGPMQMASLPSQQRMQCPECAAHAYIPMKAALSGYTLGCGDCNRQMEPVDRVRRAGT